MTTADRIEMLIETAEALEKAEAEFMRLGAPQQAEAAALAREAVIAQLADAMEAWQAVRDAS